MDDSFDDWLKERSSELETDDGRLSPGTVIGAYRIEAFLGKGGFAEVYRARGQDGEHVAIKMLHRLDEQSRMRFERESRILSQIHHPNIPKLLSFGSCGDRPYLVTELLQTKELPRTDKAVARFIKSVCAAADALHKMGYVHRDIKPSNVLWRGDTPVLIDFGLACLKSETPRSPSTISIVDGQRIVVGTAGYAAPEQFAGGRIDETTDVHAIGMLADACFNGKPPKCWRKIIARATNSRNYGRFPTASALSLRVTLRHIGRQLLAVCLTIAFIYNLFVSRQGFSSAMCGIGACLETIKQSELAAQLYSFAAKLDTDKWDNGRTFVALGDCYAKGLGVRKDYNVALGWYRKATDRDITLAKQKETNLFAVARQETLQRYFAIPESTVHDEGVRKAGYELLGKALGDALSAVVTNETAKVDLARVAEKSGNDSKQSDMLRFILHQGAFGLYVDSGETNQAKRVLIDMWRKHHDEATKLLEMMHNWKVDFGIKCKDPNCPLLFGSLWLLSCKLNFGRGWWFGVHGATPKEVVNIDELEFGESEFAQDAELDEFHICDNPVEVWRDAKIPTKWKTVKFKNPGWETISAELYFTQDSGSLYEVVFYAIYDSGVPRKTACENFERIKEFVNTKWGGRAEGGWLPNDWANKMLVQAHARALKRSNTFHVFDLCEIVQIRSCDYGDGVGDIHVDGELLEDPHNCKIIRIYVRKEVELLKAWEEGGVNPLGATCANGWKEGRFKNSLEYFLDGCKRGHSRQYLGALGRAYDRGCYGVESNYVKAVLFYSLASSKGNERADCRLNEISYERGLFDGIDSMPTVFWDVRSKISAIIDKREKKLYEKVLELLHNIDDLPSPQPSVDKDTTAKRYSFACMMNQLCKIENDPIALSNKINNIRSWLDWRERKCESESLNTDLLKRAVVCDSQGNTNEWYYDEMDNGIRLAGLTEDTFAERLEIPDKIGGKPVVSIGAGLSKGYLVKEVSTPASVIEIGERAFYNLFSLRNIKLPAGLKSIGPSAFEMCSNLEEIEIPTSVEVIGHKAFANTGLRSISIPDSVREFGEDVFQLCDNLTNMHFGAGIKSFHPDEFSFRERLQEVNIPPLVDEIKKWGLYDVFMGCRNLECIHVDPRNPYFSEGQGMLFDKARKKVIYLYGHHPEIMVPEGIVEISDGSVLESFWGNGIIKKIVLPNSLRRIGNYAFQNCDVLEQIFIPAGVEKIGIGAFARCDNLKLIEVDPANQFYSSTNGVLFDKSLRTVICVPGGISSVRLPENVQDIEPEAFSDCTDLTAVVIPKSVNRIAPGVFDGCRKLKSVTFLGDAPDIRSVDGFYAGHVWDVTTYVTKESKGWGVAIPGMWQKRSIRYVQTN